MLLCATARLDLVLSIGRSGSVMSQSTQYILSTRLADGLYAKFLTQAQVFFVGASGPNGAGMVSYILFEEARQRVTVFMSRWRAISTSTSSGREEKVMQLLIDTVLVSWNGMGLTSSLVYDASGSSLTASTMVRSFGGTRGNANCFLGMMCLR